MKIQHVLEYSCKQTEIPFDALNELFDGSHLVNEIAFSIEKSKVSWI